MRHGKTYDVDFPSLSSAAKQAALAKLRGGEKALKAGPGSAPSVNQSLAMDTITLLSLPDELLIRITLLTDKPTALALARVSKRLSHVGEHLIWRDLRLSAPTSHKPEYGGLDRVLHGISLGLRGEQASVGKADKAVVRRAMVRSVTVVPRAYANKEMVYILGLVSQNLRSLTVEEPNDPCDQRTVGCDTFDHHVFHANLTFPVLRDLVVGPMATRYPRFTRYLPSLAPKPETLRTDIQASRLTKKDLPGPTFPLLPSTTRIRYLHISRSQSARDYQRIYLTSDLSLFPDLRTLFLDLPNANTVRARTSLIPDKRQKAICLLLGQLGKLDYLEDFIWDVSPADFHACMALVEPGFGCLRRLVLGSVVAADMFGYIPILPVLEDMYFYASSNPLSAVAPSSARSNPGIA